jgi:HK97 family phage portal protein
MARGLAKLLERAAPGPIVGFRQNSVDGFGSPLRNAYGNTVGSAFGLGGSRSVSAQDANAILSGAVPGETDTMALSAAWRCQHILSDGIGALDIFAYDITEESRRVETPAVLSDPWPVFTPVEWRAMVVASLVLYGNAYLLPYDMDPRTGYPRQLLIVHPTQMNVDIVGGVPRYRLVGSNVELDCLHIRGLLMPGAVCGVGIVEAMRLGIMLASDMDRYQIGNFQQSSVPPVIIKVNRPEISPEQALDIQSRWVNKHGFGRRAPAVIPTSMDVSAIAWSPEDTQFLESKQFMAAEVCWWFGIDPRILGLSASGQSLTYSNVESTYVDLQRMSFLPWTSRIEAALGRVLPRTRLAKFDFTPMLRTTLQDRYSAYKTGIEGGWITIEEVRALENLGPLGTTPAPVGTIIPRPNQSNPTIPVTEGSAAA